MGEKKEQTFYKIITKVSLFLIIFIILLSIFSAVFKNKNSAENIRTFYELPKNSIDVIFAGTSHPLFAFQPMLIWEEYGIPSYNICQGGQMIAQTYYCLEEAFRFQNPQVVVFDLYYIIKDSKYGNIEMAHTTIDNLKWSPIKIKAIIDTVPRKNWIDFFVPLTIYHSRWEELNERDFSKLTNRRRGASVSFKIEPQEPEFNLTDEFLDISEPSLDYLNRIIKLCNDNKADLIFTVVPYNAGKDNDKKTFDQQFAIFNSAFKIAEKYGIPYINYLELIDEIGFDFQTDLFDSTHINLLGAEKISSHIGNYLRENYQLDDYRNNIDYLKWNEDLKGYKNELLEVKTKHIKNCNTFNGYLKLIGKEADYTVFMSLGGNDVEGLSEKTLNIMKDFGIKNNLSALNGNSWIAIIDGGKLSYEESKKGLIEFQSEYNDKPVKIFSNGEGS
ncbi:MAG TPA: hypothetical protein GXX18_04475 [Bacillales bacterium]|nr:hypothetical protein [Bacillales bacterium]